MKMMLLALALVFVSAGLGGCQSMGLNTDLQKIEASCATATAAVNTLTVADKAGKLTDAQRKDVLKAINVTTPICTQETPPTLDAVKEQAFQAAITALSSLAAKY